MTQHVFEMPVTEAQVRQLRVNDTVTLQRTLYGIRDATQIHLFDRGRTHAAWTCKGHAVIHTAPNVKQGAARVTPIQPVMRRCASAPPRQTAWSASRVR